MPEYFDMNADFKMAKLSPGGEILVAYWKAVATNFFCYGHGTWVPQVGFTRVPTGCSMFCYTPANSILNTSYLMALDIYDGGTPEPFDTYSAGNQVPNYVLSPLPPSAVNPVLGRVGRSQYRKPFSVILTAAHVKLSDIFKAVTLALPGRSCEFHWTACRLTQFKNTSAVIGSDMRSARAKALGLRINQVWTNPDSQYTQNRVVFDSITDSDL